MTGKSISSAESNLQNRSEWSSKKIVKRDFWLIPIYLVANNIIPLLLLASLYIVFTLFDFKNEALLSDENILITASVIAEIVILYSFYLMHFKDHLIVITRNRFKAIRKYFFIIVGTYVMTLGLISLYEWMVEFLPESLQFNETQNQMLLEEMFDNNLMLPFLFVDIVILTPIIEELLFRHLIIHELGKKITYTVASILSVILFAGVHVLGANSPFEIGSYLIIGAGLVFVYVKSGMNLAVSITLHALNNLVSFIAIVLLK
ncbi:CPBP family intramembrane glutamic endopeptidase [Staphylococcus edaphicus]|uniref:CPBP family intramembrane metalloprotease n=1 Tax=Staphylococcus edaphicus TaxID=1955013 RepID=A0A2C6WNB2_9STAP|nr:type II CAAX endopeptidase family protein [Staphylococcus edaphicus]PHK48937.1 CPBP family intramembrane metalloprotease [Staphylococcus edaphicus]UQW81975.1 CPBP family intramembrane metalloprotease [Staphylococcus edaphicus]